MVKVEIKDKDVIITLSYEKLKKQLNGIDQIDLIIMPYQYDSIFHKILEELEKLN